MPTKYFQYPEEGVMLSKSGARVFALGETFGKVAVDILRKQLGSGAEAMLFHLGCAYGEAMVKTLQPNLKTQDPAKIIAYLAEYGKAGGWGVFDLDIEDVESERVIITVQKNVFYGTGGLCFFLKGVLKGLSDSILPSKRQHKITETTHSQEVCAFHVELEKGLGNRIDP